ncbi:MAG: ankyrin repeat domain-containing protein [Alphaproteobacteria bacterium]|nr:ankyrin repeat domain-containing protein [Alphaproteobacteria bacterium]OJV12084.1 MAG: hypothetical protein BGO27_05010 [Alphaproteobacteria bacterium 33-17]
MTADSSEYEKGLFDDFYDLGDEPILDKKPNTNKPKVNSLQYNSKLEFLNDLSKFLENEGHSAQFKEEFTNRVFQKELKNTIKDDTFSFVRSLETYKVEIGVFASRLHHVVSIENFVLTADLLQEHIYSSDIEDKFGDTPLHYAAKNGNPKIIALLVAHRADINKANKNGKTPLDIAMAYADSLTEATIIIFGGTNKTQNSLYSNSNNKLIPNNEFLENYSKQQDQYKAILSEIEILKECSRKTHPSQKKVIENYNKSIAEKAKLAESIDSIFFGHISESDSFRSPLKFEDAMKVIKQNSTEGHFKDDMKYVLAVYEETNNRKNIPNSAPSTPELLRHKFDNYKPIQKSGSTANVFRK